MAIDVERLKASADLVGVVGSYVALRKRGQEYRGLCPFHPDKNPSFYVVPAKRMCHCFACGWGGDIIDFVQQIEGVDFKAAAEKLGAENVWKPKAPTEPVTQTADRITDKPPPGVPVPDMRLSYLGGDPAAVWTYRDTDGQILGYIARYATPEGKEIRCWSWGRRGEGAWRWNIGAWNKPRPLYGLEKLTDRPSAPILIVEGEKSADAAQALLPLYAVLTWPGGAKAVKHANWAPLHGRKLLIWPDADDAGISAARKIAEKLHPHCPQIKIVDTTGQPEGWDLADAELDGWTTESTIAWAKPRAHPYEPNPAPQAVEEAAQPGTPSLPEPAPAPAEAGPVESLPAEPPPPEPPAEIQPYQDPKHPRRPNEPDWMQILERTKAGPNNNLDNVVRVIEHDPDLQGRIWYDEFLDSICTDWQGEARRWRDSDDVLLQLWIQRHVGLHKISAMTVHDAALVAAFRNVRNECREWLTSLQWDGENRLNAMLSEAFGAEQNAYTDAVGRCWFISMIARVMEPGCKVDTVPVLEGAQGVGKSTALKIIGGKWFIECHESVLSKDWYGVLDGHMLVEISEMHSFTRGEVERVKGLISCQVDRYRKAYGRNTEDHPRQSVLVCTTNRDDWQRDETGARRFWPVLCGKINQDWLRANRDQLFAEALHLYREGVTWWEVPETAQADEVEKRRDSDIWESAIASWCVGKERTTSAEVLTGCIGLEIGKHGMSEQKRIARVLRALGWKQRTTRDGGVGVRVWERRI